MKPEHRTRRGSSAVLCTALLAGLMLATVRIPLARDDLEQLKGLSLEQLANLETSILSRRPERTVDSAAAVYVVTSEDIRRTGYTSVAEVLQLVPGLDVARIDTAEWAISSRGFNSRFANKLLVLIDGRSVYTPLFSGTFRESIDTMLEDIERIEVIRGPGAPSWGANAVNGVINIITRHAVDTQGGLVSGYIGAAARFGAALGDTGYFRLYAKHDDRDGQLTLDGPRDDDEFSGGRAGFHAGWAPTGNDNLTLQGELFDDDPMDPWIQGGHLLFHWENTAVDGAVNDLQLHYDRYELRTGDPGDAAVNEGLDTLDLELRRRFAPIGRHDLVGGIGYRLQRSAIEQLTFTTSDPATRTSQRFSAFIQDEIRLLDERWYLTLGTKLEHNDFSGFELQPTLRTRWHPDRDSTLWAAVSRAMRTPSRGESDLISEVELASGSPATGGLPVTLLSTPSRNFTSEELVAYELGYRWRSAPAFSLDLSLFYNDYDSLRTVEQESPGLATSPPPRLQAPVTADNLMQGSAYGMEMAVEWRPQRRWRLQASYSLLRMDLERYPQSTDPKAEDVAGQSPQQQVGLRVSWDIAPDLELDLVGRYVDRLPELDVNDYTELDARLGWQISYNFSLALAGRNLLNPHHQEYGLEALGSEPHNIKRELYLRA